MLFLLSPAKSLDYDTPATTDRHTLPQFIDESAALIEVLQPYTPAQIASLMDLSDALATAELFLALTHQLRARKLRDLR